MKPERKATLKFDHVYDFGEGKILGFNDCYDQWQVYHHEIMKIRDREFVEKDKDIVSLKKLNDALTNNVFVEDSPALKVMVETAKIQKDKIISLEAELSDLKISMTVENVMSILPKYIGLSRKEYKDLAREIVKEMGR